MAGPRVGAREEHTVKRTIGIEHTLYRISGRRAAAVRAFCRAHTKTDRNDALVLARMPLVDDALRAFTLSSASELALKRLVKLRQRLIREAIRSKGRVNSSFHWPALGMMHGNGIGDGFGRLLKRWPDLRQAVRAQARGVAKEAGTPLDRTGEVRDRASQTTHRQPRRGRSHPRTPTRPPTRRTAPRTSIGATSGSPRHDATLHRQPSRPRPRSRTQASTRTKNVLTFFGSRITLP